MIQTGANQNINMIWKDDLYLEAASRFVFGYIAPGFRGWNAVVGSANIGKVRTKAEAMLAVENSVAQKLNLVDASMPDAASAGLNWWRAYLLISEIYPAGKRFQGRFPAISLIDRQLILWRNSTLLSVVTMLLFIAGIVLAIALHSIR